MHLIKLRNQLFWILLLQLAAYTGQVQAVGNLRSTLPPEEVKQIIREESRRQNFPAHLALAVAEVESAFNTNARSKVGALGVMQIMPRTAWGEYKISPHELLDPLTNIRTGIRFLKKLDNQYKGRTKIALSHYNGGSKVRRRDGSLRVIKATQGYVDKVLRLSKRNRLEGLYEEPSSIASNDSTPTTPSLVSFLKPLTRPFKINKTNEVKPEEVSLTEIKVERPAKDSEKISKVFSPSPYPRPRRVGHEEAQFNKELESLYLLLNKLDR